MLNNAKDRPKAILYSDQTAIPTHLHSHKSCKYLSKSYGAHHVHCRCSSTCRTPFPVRPVCGLSHFTQSSQIVWCNTRLTGHSVNPLSRGHIHHLTGGCACHHTHFVFVCPRIVQQMIIMHFLLSQIFHPHQCLSVSSCFPVHQRALVQVTCRWLC